MAEGTSSRMLYLSVLLSTVLVVLTGGTVRAQPQSSPASPQPKAALLNLPVPLISGPGYQDQNIADAFQIGNRRGHDPFRKQSRAQLQNADSNGGNTNYLLTVPVISLPGRGLNVTLNVYYNSQMWTKQTQMEGISHPIPVPVMVFNHDDDWPAPGWSLSLGKVIQVGSSGGVLQDSDGTLHPYVPTVRAPLGSYHTTDGSLIDYTWGSGPNNTFQATARFPNGKAVTYGACSNNACYATSITDANGNSITIRYVQNAGPRIDNVQDSRGRAISFNYDSPKDSQECEGPWATQAVGCRLVSIVGPGLQGSTRPLMRLHYAPKTLEYLFSVQTINPTEPVYVIDGIYFPGTSIGYWFADVDSYSTYGMISKVSQRRGMTWQPGITSSDQGKFTQGTMTRERLYDYPLFRKDLAGPPTYTKMTETWMTESWAAGMVVPPPPGCQYAAAGIVSCVTNYSVNSTANPRTVDTVYPDGTRVSQAIGETDGLLYSQSTYDPSGSRLQEIDYKYAVEDYSTPSLKSTTVTDQLGQSLVTTYAYAQDLDGQQHTNQVVDTRQFDYPAFGGGTYYGDKTPANPNMGEIWINSAGNMSVWNGTAWTPPAGQLGGTYYGDSPVDQNLGEIWIHPDGTMHVWNGKAWIKGTVLRLTHVEYVTDPKYQDPNIHIFNLPQHVYIEGENGSGDIFAKTDYAYDQQISFPSTSGVVGYTDPGTTYRGNVTQVIRYKSTPPDLSNSIAEYRKYDTTGNLIEVSGPCCVDTNFTYSIATQFAYPDQITQGNAGSTAHVSQSFTYDFNTGLPVNRTDANGLLSTSYYDNASLRLVTQSFPAAGAMPLGSSGYVQYVYDDVGTYVTQYSYMPGQGACTPMPCQPSLAAESTTSFNGLGLVQRVQTLGDGNIWSAVSREYDSLGRLWQVSEPYQLLQQPTSWTITTYDSLNRVTSIAQDRTPVFLCFNEARRPSSASSSLPGQTVRVIRNIPKTSSFNCGSQHSVAPNSRESWQRMDALGRLAEVVEPSPPGDGSVFEPEDIDTVYNYGGLGLLEKVLQGSNQQERDFQYDALGRLTAEYLPEKSRSLNAQGDYVGAQSGQWSDVFNYDDRSNLISQFDARGVKTVYDFVNDPLNRLHIVSFLTPPAVDPASPILATPATYFGYMRTGDVTRVETVATETNGGWVSEQYSYDPPGLIATKALSYPGQDDALVLTSKYDGLYRLREQIYPKYGTPSQAQKTVDYELGMGGSQIGLKINGADYASKFTYNLAGQATSVTVGPAGSQQTTETYNYDLATGLLSWQTVQIGSITKFLCYFYYPSHQLQTLQTLSDCNRTSGSGGTSGSHLDTLSYDYDAVGRLHDVKAIGATEDATGVEAYSYDGYGNRISAAASGKWPDGSPIPLDSLAGSPTPRDGLSALNYDPTTNHVTTLGFCYDAAGNQIRTQRSDGSWVRYQYDEAGRLAQVSDDSGTSLDSCRFTLASGKWLEKYAYGADSRRLQKSDPSGGSTFYFWDGSHVIAEYSQQAADAKLTWSNSRVYLGGRILATFVAATSKGPQTYYHHPDRLGVRFISNDTDNTLTEQTTLPFGTLILGSSADAINPIFTTYDRSSATDLDYALNRHYEPKERFVQVDPSGMAAANLANPQSLNSYSYVTNDPINKIDPSGLYDNPGECHDTPDSPDAGCSEEVTVGGYLPPTTIPGFTPASVAPAPESDLPGGLPPRGMGVGGGGASWGTTSTQGNKKYTCTHAIGPVTPLVTPESAMSTIKAMPNVVFPFSVVPLSGQQQIVEGASYDLQGVFGPFSSNNPVTVVNSTATSFAFLTGPGHFRGPGQTITFDVFADAGTLYLQQTGTSSGGGMLNTISDIGAPASWNQQAANLSAALYGGSRADLVCQP